MNKTIKIIRLIVMLMGLFAIILGLLHLFIYRDGLNSIIWILIGTLLVRCKG